VFRVRCEIRRAGNVPFIERAFEKWTGLETANAHMTKGQDASRRRYTLPVLETGGEKKERKTESKGADVSKKSSDGREKSCPLIWGVKWGVEMKG